MRLGLAKFGYIGSSFIDKLLDERAEREDLDVFCVGSGSKMDSKSSKEVSNRLLEVDCDAYLVVSPNPSSPSFSEAIELFEDVEEPVVVLGDYVGKKAIDKLKKVGIGYVFVYGDPLIGARKELLDPIEMADFNSNVLRVLSNTGVFRELVAEVDRLVDSVKKGSEYLPKRVLDPMEVVSSEFENPYAMAKARGALEIAEDVADKNTEACFNIEEKERYLKLVSASHEMMQKAAELAKEAREIEKSNDSVLRQPHDSNGELLFKRELLKDFESNKNKK